MKGGIVNRPLMHVRTQRIGARTQSSVRLTHLRVRGTRSIGDSFLFDHPSAHADGATHQLANQKICPNSTRTRQGAE